MAEEWAPKDPDEITLRGFEWTVGMLPGDTLTGSTWIVPAGLTVASEAFDDTTTAVKLSGGLISDKSYTITNRVTTAGGETLDQSAKLKMVTR